MNINIIKQKNIATIISIVLLLLAIPSGLWPYGYYIFLRWVVFGTTLFILWAALKAEKIIWFWIMAGIAILFNPIFSIHLKKETWQIVDIIVALILVLSIFKIKKYE
jgi:hypothetical protein